MAESSSKRLRQEAETFDFEDSNSKRHKPYSCILSLLDQEEENEEENEQLSEILTALQQELSSTTAAAAEDDGTRTAEEDEGVKSVMRHLLEASDDELGIPNYAEENNKNNSNCNNEIPLTFFDNGVWEFDDVAAYYHTILQSELFM